MDRFAMIRESLLSAVKENPDRALLEQIAVTGDPGCVHIDCPTVFIQRYLSRTYHDLIISTVRTCLEKKVEVDIRVAGPSPQGEDKETEAQRRVRPIQMTLPTNTSAPATTGLNANFTFDEFVVGRCNAFAYEAAQAVSDGEGPRYNPLFFYSDIGLGKSHIAHAIGNRVLRLRPNTPVRYITARDFAHDYIHSIRNDCLKSFRNLYRSSSIDMFFIDDVHLFKNKEKTQIELCHVMDELVSSGKQVIMSGFRPPSSIPNIDKGLRSRLSAGLVIDIKRPDKATRAKIVKRKGQKNGVEIPDDVVDFISETVHTNIRDLESAVMTITAMSSLMKRPVTMELAREMLEGTIAKQRAITIPYILEFVSKSFTVPKEILVSSSRKKDVVYPRQVAIYLCRRYTDEPLASIGQAFCRNHSSVIHSLETIEHRYNNDLKVRRDIDFLIDKIEAEFS